MRCPARAIHGHIVWGTDGSVWAVYRGPSLSYPHLSVREKLTVHAAQKAAFNGLPDESILFSVCREIHPEELERRMVEGVDIVRRPVWAEFVAQVGKALLNLPPVYERRNYLAMRLPDADGVGIGSALGAAASLFGRSFGLPARPVPRREIETQARQAAELEAQVTRGLSFQRVRAGELLWLYERAVRLGVDEPPFDTDWEPRERTFGEGARARVSGPMLSHLWDVVVKEGGDRTDPGRPRHRRYLRIECPDADAYSYQSFLCVADMPKAFSFPSGLGEWFQHANAVEFPVDWFATIRAVPNEKAKAKSRRQARELAHQYSEHDGEPSGVPTELMEAHAGIERERAELAADPNTPELEVTIVLTVAAASLEELELQAKELQALFASAEYRLARPTGGQEQLRAKSLPGASAPPVARDYTQFLLPRDLAAGVPFAGGTVGDPRGMLIGHSLDAGTFQPVFIDPAYGPAELNRSGSLGVFGALGSGKSYFLKCLGWGSLARGGQLVVLDRTRRENQEAEWVRFAEAAPGRTQVVRLSADAPVCLDPLRLFRGEGRETYTRGFLTLLTGVSALSREGIALARAVEQAAKSPSACIRDVLDVLAGEAESNRHVDAVLEALRYFAGTKFGALVFGVGKVLTLSADCIVFDVPGLSLPSKEQLVHEHLFRSLPPEQLFNSALLYLLAAIIKQVIFSNPRRLGIGVFDEASFLTASPQGRDLALEIVRDGRKNAAVGWFASQHPDDMLEDQRLLALLGSRFIFRQSHDAAKAALRFVGMDPEDSGAVELVSGRLDRGRCLMRDIMDRLGLVQILDPPSPVLRKAFDTRPVLQSVAADHSAAAEEITAVPVEVLESMYTEDDGPLGPGGPARASEQDQGGLPVRIR